MKNDALVSLINKRGRIIWVESKEIPALIKLGLKEFPNPKQDYYPDYDQSFSPNAPAPHWDEGEGEGLDTEVVI